ncbi:MAG: hypothetical protein KGR69_08895, partial [Verrucomicrobia bacterium]|nr:hypothetical protein [Verrucomicrobiota bacterium]
MKLAPRQNLDKAAFPAVRRRFLPIGLEEAELRSTASRSSRKSPLPPGESNEPNPLDRLADLFERGWVHGSETFRDLVLGAFAPDPKQAKDRGRAATNSNYRSSELGKAFTEAEAGRLLTEGLEHFGLDEAALRMTPKGDWRKVAVAWAICERTTARQEW